MKKNTMIVITYERERYDEQYKTTDKLLDQFYLVGYTALQPAEHPSATLPMNVSFFSKV
jgi:hypothetical protein